MPNWIECFLDVKGSKKAIADLLPRIKVDEDKGTGDYEIFESLYPPPSEILNAPGGKLSRKNRMLMKETYGVDNYHDWACKYWGTKWGDCDTKLDAPEPKSLSWSFGTAWTCPVPAMDKIASDYPDLQWTLYCIDEAFSFRAEWVWENGKLLLAWEQAIIEDKNGCPLPQPVVYIVGKGKPLTVSRIVKSYIDQRDSCSGSVKTLLQIARLHGYPARSWLTPKRNIALHEILNNHVEGQD
jgi:hypothetical protein